MSFSDIFCGGAHVGGVAYSDGMAQADVPGNGESLEIVVHEQSAYSLYFDHADGKKAEPARCRTFRKEKRALLRVGRLRCCDGIV